jgi:hypothetical protein
MVCHLLLQETAGSLQSLCWGSSAVGGIASAYFSGSLVQAYGSQAVFGLTAVFPLIVSASALLIDEQRVLSGPSGADHGAEDSDQAEQGRLLQNYHIGVNGRSRQRRGNSSGSSSSSSSAQGSPQWLLMVQQRVAAQGLALWGAVKQRHILLPTVFVFLWQVDQPDPARLLFHCSVNKCAANSLNVLAAPWLHLLQTLQHLRCRSVASNRGVTYLAQCCWQHALHLPQLLGALTACLV